MSKWNTFDRIWNKESTKSRQKLMQKLICRDIEPTKENCRDYWMGFIRPFPEGRGGVFHCNPYKNPTRMRAIGRNRYGTPFTVARQDKKGKQHDEKRRYQSGKKPPYKVGGRNPHKKRPIQ